MRLYVREVHHPGGRAGAFALDELLRPTRDERALGVPGGNAGRLVGVLVEGADQALAPLALRRRRPFLPQVPPLEAATPQIGVIVGGAVVRHELTVVAHQRLEAPVHDALPRRRAPLDAEPGHRRLVRGDVALADQQGPHPEGAEIVSDGPLVDPQGKAVAGRTVRAHVAPGVGRHARGPAAGRLRVGVLEAHSARGETVDGRGAQGRVPGAAEVVETQLIAHDPQRVAGPGHRLTPSGRDRATGYAR